MSKFSKKLSSKTVNYMGSTARKYDKQTELTLAVLNSFIDNKYYESSEKRLKRIVGLVEKNKPDFVAKLAYVTRTDFYMRSTATVLLGELSKTHRGDSLVSDTIEATIQRVDDITELVAYLEGKLSKQVKRGIRHALYKFNRYQLAKYRGEKNKYKLVDVFNLVHPKPQFADEEQKKAWKDLIEDKLRQFDTWENDIKKLPELIMQNKVGYMALLRNLNNLARYKVSEEVIERATSLLTNKEAIKKSKQFPYRFLSAYKALMGEEDKIKFEKDDIKDKLQDAVKEALEISVGNIPLLEGKTVILVDNSGSMRGDGGGSSAVSANSNRKMSDIANLFGVLYWQRAENTYVGLFGDQLIKADLDRAKDIFENYEKVDSQAQECGNATETGIFDFFQKAIASNEMFERVIVFTDTQIGTGCELYDASGNLGEEFNLLTKRYLRINTRCRIYVVDLQGYGDTVFDGNVVNVGGWSDKLFDFIENIEKGDSLIEYIRSIKLEGNNKTEKRRQRN